jgi:phytoene dehydrogenase-like protein
MTYDAIIVGSGPNGLAAGITLARQGWRVLLLEAKETIGGGMRTAELTLPGFRHDICSAIHPLGMGSPFFKSLPLLSMAWNGFSRICRWPIRLTMVRPLPCTNR